MAGVQWPGESAQHLAEQRILNPDFVGADLFDGGRMAQEAEMFLLLDAFRP